MSIELNNITGLVLSGGQGSRVGDRDKGLIDYQGKKLIEHQLDWFSKQIDQVIISANRNLPIYAQYSVILVSDDVNRHANSKDIIYNGPLSGIISALKVCQTDWLFVQPVDVPLLPVDLLFQLSQKITQGKNAYYLVTDKREHYLSMLIAKSQLTSLESFVQSGERRVRDFLDSIEAKPVNLEIDENMFKNLNHLVDYNEF